MTMPTWTKEGEAMTALILGVFRLNGRLITAGDRLVADLGLTSARWQVLGSLANAEPAQTVSWHARAMGHHRQGVQRIVNELKTEGIVELQRNPHHKRAHLVTLTQRGNDLYRKAMGKQIPWVNGLVAGVDAEDIETTLRVLDEISVVLDESLG